MLPSIECCPLLQKIYKNLFDVKQRNWIGVGESFGALFLKKVLFCPFLSNAALIFSIRPLHVEDSILRSTFGKPGVPGLTHMNVINQIDVFVYAQPYAKKQLHH